MHLRNSLYISVIKKVARTLLKVIICYGHALRLSANVENESLDKHPFAY